MKIIPVQGAGDVTNRSKRGMVSIPMPVARRASTGIGMETNLKVDREGNGMKKFIFCLILLTVAHLSHAAVSINGGVNLGQFAPHDDLVTETFDDNYYFDGFVGLEGDNNFEMLVSLGRYSDISHHPDDFGLDATLRVTPFVVDVCYLFFPDSDIRPYLGAGVGAYFYNFSDDVVGTIDKGTVFGPNIMAGIKFQLADHFFVKTQYVRHFIPPIPELMFHRPHDFESSQITIAFGFSLDAAKRGRPNVEPSHFSSSQSQAREDHFHQAYPYSRKQEEVLVLIQQTDYKLHALKVAKWKHREELESLLKDGNKNKENIEQLNSVLENLEKEIDRLAHRREELRAQWRLLADDVRPLEEHIYFIERNYHLSPWDLRYHHGCCHYSLEQDHCDLPDYGFPHDREPAHLDDLKDRQREAERKREHLELYKDRKKIEEQPTAPEPSPPRGRSNDFYREGGPDSAEDAQTDRRETERKREHLERYKERKKIEQPPNRPDPSPPGDTVIEERPEKEKDQIGPQPQKENQKDDARQEQLKRYEERQKCEGEDCVSR